MTDFDHIRYVRQADIDREKWDRLVEHSVSGSQYGASWVLDAVCDNWDALVADDYKAVIPLPVRQKWGIRYIYQPAFIQYLPLLSAEPADDELINALFKKIYLAVRWVDAHFNVAPSLLHSGISIRQRNNFYLPIPAEPLSIPYRQNKDMQKNLRKAEGCRLLRINSYDEVLSFYHEAYGKKYLRDKRDQHRLKLLLSTAARHEAVDLYVVADEAGEKNFAAALLKAGNRLVYIAGAPNEKGRQRSVTHFFIDQVIQKHAGENKIFDFEGSDIPSVASFYQKFQPQKEIYYQVTLNRLPWPLKLFKR